MMKPLDKALRNQLEKTVREARDIAETAAKMALEQLGVGEPNPFPHLTEEERELRHKLRVHGRQLGDSLNGENGQTMDRLIEEVAYEHWHRMLFARFLAENNLLMYPDPANPVPVTLEECEDLAAKEGAKNGWELAARFAARMLPQIFRPNSPVFQLSLPPEHQQKLEQLLDALPVEVFTASDSLGWVYQFWQAKKKDEVNTLQRKIGARELPAVTQIFTEPYMVSFLLDNSLGAWWAARRLSLNDFKLAKNEEELRQKAALPGLPFKYLRFVRTEDGSWAPAAGNFGNWSKSLSEFRTIDPCCGSGHFLVAALLMLIPMRMELENISARQAVDLVLQDNIHGLELDQRCVELAAFSLALAAWRYPDAGGYRELPPLNVACSGLTVGLKKEDWTLLGAKDANLQFALSQLYETFRDAPTLGSLINLKLGLSKGTLIETKWEEVGPLLEKALSKETDEKKVEVGVVAHGLAKAASLLSMRYNLVFTNVPYLATRKQDERLSLFLRQNYFDERFDLAVSFISKCIDLSNQHGVVCYVSPQAWQYLGSYKKFREKILENNSLNIIARLGAGAFETISGEVVNVCLTIHTSEIKERNQYFAIDVSRYKLTNEKATALIQVNGRQLSQSAILGNPDRLIAIENTNNLPLLQDYGKALAGILNGDAERFRFRFWEVTEIGEKKWALMQENCETTTAFGGRSAVLLWENERGQLHAFAKEAKERLHDAHRRGSEAWGRKGIAISRMGTINCTLYSGNLFDQNVAVIIPTSQEDLPAMWCFCISDEYTNSLKLVNPNLAISSATVAKVKFDKNKWAKVARTKYPLGLPLPYSEDPTQWIFHGHPAKSNEPLQVAVVRMLDYCWPAELDSSMELSDDSRLWIKGTDALKSFVDEDGIVCITSVRGEVKAEERLENLLATAFGAEWSPAKKAELLAKADHAGKTLESWLRDKFFTQHCKLFHDRPFIWHIWDGLNDGFAALVNYHKLDYKLLETLIYTYLGDWISQQKQEKARGVDGAEEKLAAAEGLKKRLELILEGEKPYDIFVRWKSIEQQPIGWNPDLNDGVRVNIRPFMTVPDVGKKGAGVLRDKPNINWGKDRGRDVESAPWFKLGPMYGGKEGDRINDHHLTLAEKRAAREKKSSK